MLGNGGGVGAIIFGTGGGVGAFVCCTGGDDGVRVFRIWSGEGVFVFGIGGGDGWSVLGGGDSIAVSWGGDGVCRSDSLSSCTLCGKTRAKMASKARLNRRACYNHNPWVLFCVITKRKISISRSTRLPRKAIDTTLN